MPVIAKDYMGLKKSEHEEGENSIIVVTERKYKNKLAHVLRSKGADGNYTIEQVAADIIALGQVTWCLKVTRSQPYYRSKQQCREDFL